MRARSAGQWRQVHSHLVSLCATTPPAITDGLVELLIQIMHKIGIKAERKVVRELRHDFSRVHGKDRLLGRIAEASLGNPDGTIRKVLYPLAGEDLLINLLRKYKASGPAYTKKVHAVMRTYLSAAAGRPEGSRISSSTRGCHLSEPRFTAWT